MRKRKDIRRFKNEKKKSRKMNYNDWLIKSEKSRKDKDNKKSNRDSKRLQICFYKETKSFRNKKTKIWKEKKKIRNFYKEKIESLKKGN